MFERTSEVTIMNTRSQMLPAADTAARIVRDIPPERLDAPTPCPGWDVRTLVNHLFLWTARAETAARKQPTTGPGEDHDFTAEPGWAERFGEQVHTTAEAWQDPAAWEGNTSLTGNKEAMPATFVAGIIFGDWVVHGWDLAVATGHEPAFPDDVVRAAWEHLVPTAEVGREYGAFGPEVSVPEDAPLLDRLVGLSGRDPHWEP
ncbi:TIGR03086 family metal-binding protein [Actinomadura pelletieri]|nr:TIGR03086 family metal-binding protein [Actinomadura pelletieri]